MFIIQQTMQCTYSIMIQLWWMWRIHKGWKLQMCFSLVAMLQLQIGHDFLDKWPLVCRLAAASNTLITTIRTRHQACHQGPLNTHFFGQVTFWLLMEHNQGATLPDTIAQHVPVSDRLAIPSTETYTISFTLSWYSLDMHRVQLQHERNFGTT